MCRCVQLSEAFGAPNVPAPQLVRDLVASLPGVSNDHTDANVDIESLGEFAKWLFDVHSARLNSLSPLPYQSADELHTMLMQPLAKI